MKTKTVNQGGPNHTIEIQLYDEQIKITVTNTAGNEKLKPLELIGFIEIVKNNLMFQNTWNYEKQK